ncbi:hypothetical protein PG987_012074 [Apiospora arundinis]
MSHEGYPEALYFLQNLDTLVVEIEKVDELWEGRRLPLVRTSDYDACWSALPDETGLFLKKNGVRFRVEAKPGPKRQCTYTYQLGSEQHTVETTYEALVVAKITFSAFLAKLTTQEQNFHPQVLRQMFVDRFLSKVPKAWCEVILVRDLLHGDDSKLEIPREGPNLPNIYNALNDPTNIRVVLIKPALEANSPIQCSLHQVRLDSLPDFEALSYVWGDPTAREEILLEGERISVTQNLYFALKGLRHRYSDRIMWIDAICINQSDFQERQAQVAQMDVIYRQATGVVVWLGPETNTSSRLFEELDHMLQVMGPLARAIPRVPVWEGVEYPMAMGVNFAETQAGPMGKDCPECMGLPFSALRLDLSPDARQGLDESIKAHNRALHTHRLSEQGSHAREQLIAQEENCLKLLQRPYWDRMWVLQEVILARKLTVQCGRKSADWGFFHGTTAATLRLTKKTCLGGPFSLGYPFILMNQLQKRVSNITPFMFLQSNTQAMESLSSDPLATYLSITASAQATNPLDKVYGLLGLLPHGSVARKEFQPNYIQSPKILFIRVVKYFLATKGNLLVLTARPSKQSSKFTDFLPDLPSWAPDWTAEPDTASNVISLGPFSNFHTRSLFRATIPQAGPGGGTRLNTTIFNAGLEVDLEHALRFSHFDAMLHVYGLEVGRITSIFRSMRKPAEIRAMQDIGPSQIFEPSEIEEITKNPEPMKKFIKSMINQSWVARWNACHHALGDTYGPTGQPMQEAFWRTLCLDRFYDTFGLPSRLARIPQLTGPTAAAELFNYPRGPFDCQFPPQNPRDEEWIMTYISSQLRDGLAAFNTDFHGMLLPFFVTDNGYIGLGHPDAAVGDMVAVLRGGPVPYVLRGNKENHTLVGECYVHGIMDGELFQQQQQQQTQDKDEGNYQGGLTEFQIL